MNDSSEPDCADNDDSPNPWFRHPLAREISVILVIKLVIIAAIAYYFFGPSTKARQDPDSVASAVLDRPASPTQNQTVNRSSHDH